MGVQPTRIEASQPLPVCLFTMFVLIKFCVEVSCDVVIVDAARVKEDQVRTLNDWPFFASSTRVGR